MIAKDKKALQDVCLFIVTLYVKPWLECTVEIKAPNEDLWFLKKLKNYERVDTTISKTAISKFSHHLWYLCEETVILSFFDNEVDNQTKMKMIANLKRDKISDFGKRYIPSKEEMSQTLFDKTLDHFVSEKSKQFLRRLQIDDSFLQEDVSSWDDNAAFLEAKKRISCLKVVNDTAERAVKLMQDFHGLLTAEEEQKQFLLRCVQEHRNLYPDCGIYSLLLDDRILEIIVEETNRYAEKTLFEKTSSRLDKWKPTDKTEMKQLLGLIIWMGIVKLPEVHLYWSKDAAYAQSLPSSVLSRNRFELLLRMLHFCDNENENHYDRLYKIRVIIDMLNQNFQKCYDPGEIVCVDESLIPFRGRIIFRQYIKQKQHKYGIQIFKLCSAPGYTVNFQIYCGKKSDTEKTTPTNIVLSLCKNIFGKGHTLCTDNWYTSVDLARQLIAKNTHLIGIIRSNRRGIPKDLVATKLKCNEYIAKESLDGLTLTTRHYTAGPQNSDTESIATKNISYVWWAGIDEDIKNIAQNCSECNANRNNPPKIKRIWEPATFPYERIHIDFAGPFKGYNFLIVVDAYSKWPEVHIMNNISAKSTIEKYLEIFSRFGLPVQIISDNGRTFISEEFQQFLKENGIKHKRTAP
ncbi:hypothetical protein KPH14_011859 [Odynerus spinipes]|uniref:Integrase catalytic domain-containing protein n=1 Tax=Odynerus spinipes TaxID=1348599 RepID=A0AAD9RDZ9_9HYME|nr:hypothetical protein KPH14_011859 [Odynerus spinipes]